MFSKIIATSAVTVALLFSLNSNAKQVKNAQPKKMSAATMDKYSAGIGFNTSKTPVPRTYNLGSYSLVFNGTRWSLVRK